MLFLHQNFTVHLYRKHPQTILVRFFCADSLNKKPKKGHFEETYKWRSAHVLRDSNVYSSCCWSVMLQGSALSCPIHTCSPCKRENSETKCLPDPWNHELSKTDAYANLRIFCTHRCMHKIAVITLNTTPFPQTKPWRQEMANTARETQKNWRFEKTHFK